ncbi:MAG: hypothetical protein HC882_02440 [Acidobacteria bacterium]|nr:hypothetical protein [Acidobacteriota bacterium]
MSDDKRHQNVLTCHGVAVALDKIRNENGNPGVFMAFRHEGRTVFVPVESVAITELRDTEAPVRMIASLWAPRDPCMIVAEESIEETDPGMLMRGIEFDPKEAS